MRYIVTFVLLFSSGVFAADKPQVQIDTHLGAIVVELEPAAAPKTVENFLKYVNDGHYAGTIFHRVIDNFMIQGGGFDKQFQKKKTHPPIKIEADNGLKNDRGTIAMARTGDPNSATSQFFINVKDNDFLNHRSKDARGWGYTVFGKVISGMDVVDKIKSMPTGAAGPFRKDVPKPGVVINDAKVISSAAPTPTTPRAHPATK